MNKDRMKGVNERICVGVNVHCRRLCEEQSTVNLQKFSLMTEELVFNLHPLTVLLTNTDHKASSLIKDRGLFP